MPSRAKKPCAQPGCPNLVDHGYCPLHQAKRTPRKDTRPSRHERGYDNEWYALRKRYLRANPHCEMCGQPATQVHHRVTIADDPGLRLAWDNLAALCTRCHTRLHRARR